MVCAEGCNNGGFCFAARRKFPHHVLNSLCNLITGWDEKLSNAYQLLKKIPGAFPQIVSNAVNRTLETVRGTAGRYFVKHGEIRKTIELKKTSAGNLHGAMIPRGKRKNFRNTDSLPNSPAVNKKGFKGAVMREGGLKPLPKRAFMINTPNSGWLLFNRIRQIIKNRETVDEMNKRANREICDL